MLRTSITTSVQSGSRTDTGNRAIDNESDATFGQLVPGLLDLSAMTSVEERRLILHLREPNAASGGFRTNLGVVSADSAPIPVTASLYKAGATPLGQVPLSLMPSGCQQVDLVFERTSTASIGDGHATVRTSTSGARSFAHSPVIDNRTNDLIFIPAATIPTGSTPPTPTPSPDPVVLKVLPSAAVRVSVYR